jgi:NADH dehydrogenase
MEIVIGGGFVGLNLVELLNQKIFMLHLLTRITTTFSAHLFIKLQLHFLEPSSISYPFRKFLQAKKNLQFRLDSSRLLSWRKKVILHNGELSYDHLVFCYQKRAILYGECKEKTRFPWKRSMMQSICVILFWKFKSSYL